MVLDHYNKMNIRIENQKFFGFQLHMKVMFILYCIAYYICNNITSKKCTVLNLKKKTLLLKNANHHLSL